MKIAEQHDADLVFFQVQRQAAHVVRKLEQLDRHDFFKSVHLSDAVADFDHSADFGNGHTCLEVLDLLPNNFVDFVCFDWFHNPFPICDCQLPI